MVVQLIPFVDDDRLPPPVRIACIEDWYMNYRLLIEFLLLRPPSNCASPEDFLPGWKSASLSRDDLIRDYGLVSEDFAHIGNLKGRSTPGGVNSSVLQPKARAILAVAEDFSQALTADAHNYAAMIRTGIDTARGMLP
jgi:hypothetical protein